MLLYAFLAWYLDQVVPSEYGVHRPPHFLCKPSFWLGARVFNSPPSSPLETNLASRALDALLLCEEPAAPAPSGVGVRAGVCTMRLRKEFKRHVAVAGLDVEMRPGQISALLGANGAGKTTTISMLTGLIPPTSGDALIDGKSIRTCMRSIRAGLGVCPQVQHLLS